MHTTPLQTLIALGLALCPFPALAQDDAPAAVRVEADSSPTIRVEGERLTITFDGALPREFSLGCAPNAHGVAGGVLAVACDRRVRLVTLRDADEIAVTEDVRLEHSVVDIYARAGRLWIELDDGTAVAADAMTRAPAPEPEASPSASTGAPAEPDASLEIYGHVVDVRRDRSRATVDVGERDGLLPGARMALTSGEAEPVIAEVVAVSPTTAEVRYGFNEDVDDGAAARSTDQQVSASVWRFPEYRMAFRASGRAGLILGDLGFTASVDGAGTFRFGRAAFARVALRPTGASVAKGNVSDVEADTEPGRDFGFGGGYGLVGYEFGYGAAGIGLGFDQAFTEAEREWDPLTNTRWVSEPWRYGPRLSLPMMLRVGTEDGYHVEWTTLLTSRESRIRLHAFDARVQVPIGGAWLFAEGSGGIGTPGFHAALGVRYRMRGNGGPGTTLLLVAAGATGTTRQAPTQADGRFNNDRTGPAAQVGIETRL